MSAVDTYRAVPRDPEMDAPVDARAVAFVRFALAASALAIIYLDPTEPARFVELTYASLSVYCVAAAVLLASTRRSHAAPMMRWAHWVDVACAGYFISLTQGTNSIFYFFFLFAMLVASFTRGFREGIAVTAASAVLFMIVGFIFRPGPEDFELNRALIRPIYLVALGTLMAFWGGRELMLRRRLVFLRDIGRHWNPRLGADRALGANLERLLAFFDAAQCLLVVQKSPAAWITYVAAQGARRAAHIATPIDESSASVLMTLPREAVLAYARQPTGGDPGCDRLASLLETDSFATVPYAEPSGRHGRLYVSTPGRVLARSDLEFLVQALESVAQIAENSELTEQLLKRGAERERYRLSLDIHDTTVQPYIGLKLGLDALVREAGEENPLGPRISELVAMADETIRDLRGFAAELREPAPRGGEALVAAVQRHAEHVARYQGIDIEIRIDPAAALDERVSPEIFRMICEGLSNVVRHTNSRRARVELERVDSVLRLVIANEVESAAAPFVPESIMERARLLGAPTRVRSGPWTIVEVDIPQ